MNTETPSTDWHGTRMLAQAIADKGQIAVVASHFDNNASTEQPMTYMVLTVDTDGMDAESVLETLGVEEDEEDVMGGNTNHEVFLPGTVGGHIFKTMNTPLDCAPDYDQ